MIIGECPHCDAHVMTPMAERLCFSEETCDGCGKTYWLKHSRLDPIAYPDKPKECGERIEHDTPAALREDPRREDPGA